MMIVLLRILMVLAIVVVAFFVLTFTIYFFNLDMKFAASLIKPLTAWYNWSKRKRDAKKLKAEQKSQKQNEK